MAAVNAFVGLGANLGEPRAQLRAAAVALAEIPRTQLIALSPLYRSAPVGVGGQPDFVNAVAEIETGLAPWPLLEALLALEARYGRTREAPGGARTLDLDLLLFADRLIDEPGLIVPHPRMHKRAFVLAPLAELAPDLVIPGRGPIGPLLAACKDQVIERLGEA